MKVTIELKQGRCMTIKIIYDHTTLGVVGGNGNGKQDNYNSMVNKNHRRLAGDKPNLCVSV